MYSTFKQYLLAQLQAFFSNIVEPALNRKGDSISFDSSTNTLSLKRGNTVLDTETINVSGGGGSSSSDVEFEVENGVLYAIYDDGEE